MLLPWTPITTRRSRFITMSTRCLRGRRGRAEFPRTTAPRQARPRVTPPASATSAATDGSPCPPQWATTPSSTETLVQARALRTTTMPPTKAPPKPHRRPPGAKRAPSHRLLRMRTHAVYEDLIAVALRATQRGRGGTIANLVVPPPGARPEISANSRSTRTCRPLSGTRPGPRAAWHPGPSASPA